MWVCLANGDPGGLALPRLLTSFAPCLAVFALVAGPSALAAKPPPGPPPFVIPKDTPSTRYPVAGWLEGLFQQQVMDCSGLTERVKVWKGKDKSSEVSFVPASVVNYFDLKGVAAPPKPATVWVHQSMSISTAFLTLYEPLAAGKGPGDGRTFVGDLSAGPIGVASTLPGFDGSQFAASCSAAISAAAKIDGDFKLLPATIQAALDADVGARGAYNLAFTSGLFYSPIYALWKGQAKGAPLAPEAIDPGKLYSSLVFWNFYADNPARIGQPVEMLEQLNGVAIYKTSSLDMSAKISNSVTVDVAAPFISAKGKESAELGSSSSFKAQTFALAEFVDVATGPSQTRYFQIPPIAEVVDRAGRSSRFTVAETAETLKIYNTDPITVRLRVPGIPPGLCSRNSAWGVTDQPGAGDTAATVSLEAITPVSNPDGQQNCEFTTVYVPNDPAVATGKTLNLRFALPKITAGGRDHVLALNAAPVRLTALLRPRVEVMSAKPKSTRTASGGYGWALEFQIDDGNSLVDASKNSVDITSLSLSCPGASLLVVPQYEVEQRNLVGRVLKMSLEVPSNTVTQSLAATGESCVLNGGLKLRVNTQGGAKWTPRNFPAATVIFTKTEAAI